jgi:hypothetical protein
MGLDTTHDCWHGPYSAFKDFRDAVAVAAKAEFDYVPSYEGHPMRAYMGWWDEEHNYTEPLDVFFVHSDCEGYIFPNDAQQLIPRLLRLLPRLDGGDQWSPYQRLAAFVAGLQHAVDEWEIVRFH